MAGELQKQVLEVRAFDFQIAQVCSRGFELLQQSVFCIGEHLDEAVAQYRGAVKRWPESSMSLNALGYTLADRTDQYKEAEKLIRKALKKDPESAAIIDSLGWVLFKTGEYEEALAELQRAYEKLDDPEVASHIIEVLDALDRRDEALEVLEAAESKDPDSTMLHDVRERIFPEAD